MPLNRFQEALNNVSDEYFGETERLFTYELYHELKEVFNNNPLLHHNNVVIDAELPKRRLTQQQANNLGLLPLDNLMTPDFIIHERANANNQVLVAEVKAERYLSAKKAIKDINKLIALRRNYNFQIGVFVAINVTLESIRNHIHNPDITILWPEINGARTIDPALDLHIYTKQDSNSPWEQSTLINLINNPPHNL